ncbi:hypothetical protein TRFO_18728 [Tritrichomonas foetus]|uniref:BEACH domain-containing protein n=1 Tax=Tritrichomonas foetus TaxID=1144522 RepID=A0A1J4KPN0_9EUKA|nr:hypothetical protein TRFO_18728 [Tritrichomonas foetus]|eukprot:OHT11748.1 hypothetical protein TRFO_18728 [Tritrichomonas foetus]
MNEKFKSKITLNENIANLNSIAENISALFSQINDSTTDDDKRKLIFETLPLFQQIIESKNQQAHKSEQIKNAVKSLFTVAGNHFQCILDNPEENSNFPNFINKILATKFAYEVPLSVVGFMTKLFSASPEDPSKIEIYAQTTQTFFKMQAYRLLVLKNQAIETILKNLAENEKNNINIIAFEQFTKHASFYADQKVRKQVVVFLQAITPVMPNLMGRRCQVVINFLFELVKHTPHDFTVIFSKIGLLEAISKKLKECGTKGENQGENKNQGETENQGEILYQNNALNLLLFCAKTAPIMEKNELSIPTSLLFQTFKNQEKIDNYSRQELMKYFLELLKDVDQSQNPFQTTQITMISKSIPLSDHESIKLFCDFADYLRTVLKYDMTPLMPALTKMCKNYKLMIEVDMTKLIEVFTHLGQDLIEHIYDFFFPLLIGIKPEEFASLFNKYTMLFGIYDATFGKHLNKQDTEDFMIQFLSAYPFYTDKNAANNAIKNIVLTKKGYIFTKTIFAAVEQTMGSMDSAIQLFSLLLKFAISSRGFSHQCIQTKVFNQVIAYYSKYKFPSNLILNFISAVSNHRFYPEFDHQIYQNLLENNFIDETPENLLDLALGLQIGEDRNHGNLCFPSIIWKCAPYDFKYAFDLWLCGHISMNTWARDSKQPLSNFPCICDVARQYMHPKHIRMLMKDTKLIEEICKGDFAVAPFFEFPPLKSDVSISFNSNEDSISASFWLMFTSFTNVVTIVATIGTATFTAKNDVIFLNEQQITTIKPNIWNHFVVTIDELKENVIYLNCEIIHKFQMKPFKNVTLASKNNTATWCAGCFRFYTSILTEQQVKELNALGVGHVDPSPLNESTIYSPYNILSLFKPFDTTTLQNMRPVLIYSLLDYFTLAAKGSNPIFVRAMDMLNDNQIDGTLNYVNALCSLQKKKSTGWTLKEFALYMSIICNYDTPMVSMDLINRICECFIINEKEKKFDWDSFFIFILDYRFFYTDFEPEMVNLINKYHDKFPFMPDSPLNTILMNFILTLLLLPDFNPDYRSNIFSLVYQHIPDTATILRFIVSSPDFSSDLLDYSNHYRGQNNETIEILLSLYISIPLEKFDEYYILDNLEPQQAFMIMDHVKNSLFGSNESLNEDMFLRYCQRNIYATDSWEGALSFFLGNKTFLKTFDYDLTNFQFQYLPNLFRMMAFLSFAAARLPTDSMWNPFCEKMLQQLGKLVDLIEDPAQYYNLIFIIMTLGKPLNTQSNFPLAPQIATDGEIVNCALSRGQEYPKQEPTPFEMPKVKISVKGSDLPNIGSLMPSTFYLSESCNFTMDVKVSQLNFVIMEKQTSIFNLNWNESLERLYEQFEIENTQPSDVENTNIAKALVDLLVKFILKFPESIETIMPNSIYFEPKLSLFWIQNITLVLLQIYDKENLYVPSVLDYIIHRLNEGFYASIYTDVMTYLFSIFKKNKKGVIPNEYFPSIWASINIANTQQLEPLCDLFLNNEAMLIQKSTFELNNTLTILASDSLIPFLPKSFSAFYTHFIQKLKGNDSFFSKWKKEHSNIDIKLILNGLLILGEKGIDDYTAWKSSQENQAMLASFDELLQQTRERDRATNGDIIRKHLVPFLQKLESNGSELFNEVNSMLHAEIIHKVKSSAIATAVRYYTRRSLLASVEHYLRLREYMITKTFPFNDANSSRYSMTILTDPIFPARRQTPSPLEYEHPEFPNGTADAIFHYKPSVELEFGIFPDCVRSAIYTCRFRGPSFIRRCKYPMLGRYLGISSALPATEYHILLDVFGLNKQQINYTCEASFLHGVDVLEGTAIFTPDKLYFFEGCKIRDKQVFQTHSYENDISQELYIQLYQSGLFTNNLFTFRSHYVLVTELNQITCSTNHLWIQRPFSITLNYSLGYHFVLNFTRTTYDEAANLIKAGVDAFLESAPPETNTRSPIMTARLLQHKMPKLTQMWCDGEIDNYTYIGLINRIAKRCYADLTQYPAFPWVVSDYVSESLVATPDSNNFRDLTKPMGQQSEERAKKFDAVFENSDPGYFYGTHYLHFGVVTYFMFRTDPFSVYFFLLHRGWDHPHRLFYKVLETWMSASTNAPSDVKELIPQIYKVPEILTNNSNLPLVVKDKEDVRIVELPKWAANSRHFSQVLTKFFENIRVTNYLQNWIDLIFGVNSRGQGAINTKNLFHPTCYPDGKDLGDIVDHVEKQCIISSIINFGQCSPQVFMKPHPNSNRPHSKIHLLSKPANIVMQKVKVNCQNITSIYINQSDIVAVNDPKTSILPSLQLFKSNDRTLTYQAVSNDGFLAIKVFIDGHLTIYRLKYNKGIYSEEVLVTNHLAELGVKRCAISSTHFVAFAAYGKSVLQFDVGTQRRLPPIKLKFPVNFIAIDEDAALIWITGTNSITLCSISGTILIEEQLKSEITAIHASPLPEYYENRGAMIGHSDGFVSFIGYSYVNMKLVMIHRMKIADEPIVSVAIDARGHRAIAATKTNVFDLEYIGTKEKPLSPKLFVGCAFCGNTKKTLPTCPRCSRYCCSKCLSKDPALGMKVCNSCKKPLPEQPQKSTR